MLGSGFNGSNTTSTPKGFQARAYFERNLLCLNVLNVSFEEQYLLQAKSVGGFS